MKNLSGFDLADEFQTAFCKHFCANECRANEQNDVCYCVEAGLIAAEEVRKLLLLAQGGKDAGAAAPPRLPLPLFRSHLRLVKG
jgi:hypothetical protein